MTDVDEQTNSLHSMLLPQTRQAMSVSALHARQQWQCHLRFLLSKTVTARSFVCFAVHLNTALSAFACCVGNAGKANFGSALFISCQSWCSIFTSHAFSHKSFILASLLRCDARHTSSFGNRNRHANQGDIKNSLLKICLWCMEKDHIRWL